MRSGSRYVVGNRYPSALGAPPGRPTLTGSPESSAAARKESREILSGAGARPAPSASRKPSRTVKRCSTPRPRSSAATTSDHDSSCRSRYTPLLSEPASPRSRAYSRNVPGWAITWLAARSEEHTSELQSQSNLVCRLLLEKKNNIVRRSASTHLGQHPTWVHRIRKRRRPPAGDGASHRIIEHLYDSVTLDAATVPPVRLQ